MSADACQRYSSQSNSKLSKSWPNSHGLKEGGTTSDERRRCALSALRTVKDVKGGKPEEQSRSGTTAKVKEKNEVF